MLRNGGRELGAEMRKPVNLDRDAGSAGGTLARAASIPPQGALAAHAPPSYPSTGSMATPGSPATEVRHSAAEVRVRTAVMELGAALAGVVDSLPQPIRRAADLQRALGLQTPLAWRVYRLSRAPDAAAAVEFLPTVKQLERVIAKAAKLVPTTVAERANAALSQFATVVDQVGGDQRGFESVASGLAPAGVRRVEHEHRRAAFRGNAHLWGVQCRCLIACAVERPGLAPGTRDGITLRGLIDLQALRSDIPLVVEAHQHFAAGTLIERDPAAPAAPPTVARGPTKSDLRLLPQFGGPRFPELRTVQVGNGWQETQACLPGIGRADAVSFYLHQTFTGAEDDDAPGLGMLVETPAEALHLEFIVPHGWTDPRTARVQAFASRHDVKRAYELRAADRVPLHDKVEHFAARANVPASPEIPHWPDIVRHILMERGWLDASFDVYRCRIAYPMLHAWTGLRVDRVARDAQAPTE